MKRCKKCGLEKPLDEFHNDARTRDGRKSWCKVCAIAAARQRQLDNPEAAREADRRYSASDKSKANRKRRREGPQRERILEQKRESWARTGDKHNARLRALRRSDPERFREYQRRRYEKDREKVLEQNRQWRAGNIDAVRRRWMMRNYGITPEEFTQMLNDQDGCCAICGTDMESVRELIRETLRTGIRIDHDHVTGAVRGLLCTGCNKGLGCFKDDIARLRAAADYLEKLRRDPAA